MAYVPGHYIGYSKRGHNGWEACNDLRTKVTRCESSTSILPHAAVYFRLEPSTRPLSEAQSLHFKWKSPLDDSDKLSRDNWRNKGTADKKFYEHLNDTDYEEFEDANRKDDPEIFISTPKSYKHDNEQLEVNQKPEDVKIPDVNSSTPNIINSCVSLHQTSECISQPNHRISTISIKGKKFNVKSIKLLKR